MTYPYRTAYLIPGQAAKHQTERATRSSLQILELGRSRSPFLLFRRVMRPIASSIIDTTDSVNVPVGGSSPSEGAELDRQSHRVGCLFCFLGTAARFLGHPMDDAEGRLENWNHAVILER